MSRAGAPGIERGRDRAQIGQVLGGYTAVSEISLEIRDGEFLIMVGPSGCGKTTTLNMISGLQMPTSGGIVIGDTVVNDLEPGERGLGMVFQDLALFPHMTVFENIAFGLRIRRLPTTRSRAHDARPPGHAHRGAAREAAAGSAPAVKASASARPHDRDQPRGVP